MGDQAKIDQPVRMHPGLIRWCPHEKRDKDTDTHRGGPHPLGWCPYKGKTPVVPKHVKYSVKTEQETVSPRQRGRPQGVQPCCTWLWLPAFTLRNHSCRVTTHVWFCAVAV